MKVIVSKKELGFSLIEILIVMGTVAVIGGIVVSILFSVFRGSSKASTLITLRQNGNFAMSQVSRQIRNARALVTPATCVTPQSGLSQITITGDDGLPTTFVCSGGGLASQSAHPATLLDTNNVTASCNFSCSQSSGNIAPIITFSLTVSQRSGVTAQENQASLDFKTAVSMRNLQQ